MQKMVVALVRTIAVSLVLLAHGQTTCTKFGSDPATFSPSIRINNKSGYDLRLRIEATGTNNQLYSSESTLSEGQWRDVFRETNGMITKGIRFATFDSKLHGSYTIGDRESSITITKNDLK